nr:class D sortase [Alteribacter salitolerans]
MEQVFTSVVEDHSEEGDYSDEDLRIEESEGDADDGESESLAAQAANAEPPDPIVEPNQAGDKQPGGPIALIQIDKINLTLPILPAATEANLRVGAGHLSSTAEIGAAGNAGIAAHRSHTYGRQFNRLDEIGRGDIVKVTTKTGEQVYEVFDLNVVVPEDTSVLTPFGDDAVITLITCEPMINPTHRLIVHAKRIS